MKTHQSLFAICIIAVLASCAHPVPKDIPRPTAKYVPPPPSNATARLEGSIKGVFGAKKRARVESVGFLGIPIASEAEQPAVILAAGRTTMVVVCETQMATAIDRSDIELDVQAGHEYVLKCETNNIWSHSGSNFSIIDMSDGEKVVATAFLISANPQQTRATSRRRADSL